MMQQIRKMWSNFVCPHGPFSLAQSHICQTYAGSNVDDACSFQKNKYQKQYLHVLFPTLLLELLMKSSSFSTSNVLAFDDMPFFSLQY